MVEIPILEWFTGDIFSNKGNRYVGSIGATSISANAFCFQVWLERNDGNAVLKTISYDVLSRDQSLNTEPVEFSGDPDGWTKTRDWLNSQYEKYVSDGRNDLTVEF